MRTNTRGHNAFILVFTQRVHNFVLEYKAVTSCRWRVDYVKEDSCSGCPGARGALEALKIMQDALDATGGAREIRSRSALLVFHQGLLASPVLLLHTPGRSILLSGEGGPDPAVCSATGQCGNLRRIGHDITAYWSSITCGGGALSCPTCC
eukprot:SAG31_NODE_2165_length_6281_cov_2.028308_4_plen_151_part_00